MNTKLINIASLLMILVASGCSDKALENNKDGGDDKDMVAPVGDGYGPLWPCDTPGVACNPHNPCAINPICGKDRKCRPTGLMDCNDGLACTKDVCKGMGLCAFEPIAGSCALSTRVGGSGDGGVDAGPATTVIRCFKKDERNPSDICQKCDPDTSATKWSPANGGTCDDGNACTKDDYCSNGLCKGTSYLSQCADNYGCTQDLCDGKGGCLGNKLRSNYCLINGACYLDGKGDPAGTCNFCDVAKSQSIWTPAASNTCNINSKCYRKGDLHSLKCAECEPAVSTKAWTVKGSFCLINNVCKKPNDLDTTKCSTCDPTQSKYAWTQLPGLCKIGSKCYQKNAAHAQGCICDPSKSTTAWTATGTNCVIGSTNCYAKGGKEQGGCGTCDPATSVTAWTKGTGCLAVHDWSKGFGGSSSDYGYATAVDKSGNVYITGAFYNSVNFGGGTLTSNGSTDIFVASFTPTGVHRWSKTFGSTSSDYGYGIATDSAGNVYVAGYFYNSVNFGGGSLSSNGGGDIFVASFTSTGAHRWSKNYGSTSSDYGRAIAVDASGNVYVTGNFYNTVNFGGSALTSAGGNDIFIASYTSAGAHRWSKAFGNTSSDYGYAVTTDPGGNVYISGYFYGSVNFGGGVLTGSGTDIFLASYTSTGAHRWSKNFGGTGTDYGYALATDGSSNVYLAGRYYTGANFGGGVMTAGGSYDAFIASFSSAGTYRWAKGFGSSTSSSDYSYGVATDKAGNVYVTGYYYISANFGGGTLSGSSYEIFIASYSTSGKYRWARSHGSTSSDYGRAVAVDASNNVYATGYFYNAVDFGGGPITNSGGTDIYLLKVSQ